MNNQFQISQWLKNQPIMPAPHDDFEQIYQQLEVKKTHGNVYSRWAVAAGIALMAVGVLFFYRQLPPETQQFNKTTLIQLQQQISHLEQQLQASNTVTVSSPGSTQLENQVMLEQWLTLLNNRLADINNVQQQQNLLKAKLTVLQNLNTKNQTIQLI